MTDTYENITLPQTSFAGGKNCMLLHTDFRKYPFSTLQELRKYYLFHRRDSIQGTNYIANYFLNLRVSRTKIENLKWQIGGDIIPLTFGKFVTSLVQKLKILGKKTDL